MGRGASRGRIERLMRHHGIRAIMVRPRRVRTTDSRHDLPIAPNLLERNFTATAPNRIWLADITYIETDQGWLYLAAILDLYSRRIVGWAMADHLRADLPLAALRMAISAQRPSAGLIHHSDRGVQYASAEYRNVLQSAGFKIAELERERTEVERQLASLVEPVQVVALHPAAQEHYLAVVDDLANAIHTRGSDNEMAEALRELIESVVVQRTEPGQPIPPQSHAGDLDERPA